MSFAPPGESASSIRNERSMLDGTVIGGVAYGVLFTIVCQCLHLLLCYPRNKKIQWHLVIYVVALFTLSTIAFGTEVKFNELAFVDDRNYPGGPLAYNFDQYNNPINVATFASSFVATWFADAFLTYRLFVFSNRSWAIVVGPSILLTASIAVSAVLLNQIANPTASFWDNSGIRFGTMFWVLSTTLDVLVTGTILGRIWFWRRAVNKEFKILGVKKTSSEGGGNGAFGGTVAILLESAALSLVIGVFFLIVYVKESIVMNVMMPVQGQVVAIAPLLIVLRVAQGSGWTQETVASASRIVFDSPAGPGRPTRFPRGSESVCDTLSSAVVQNMCHCDSGVTLAVERDSGGGSDCAVRHEDV